MGTIADERENRFVQEFLRIQNESVGKLLPVKASSQWQFDVEIEHSFQLPGSEALKTVTTVWKTWKAGQRSKNGQGGGFTRG